MALNILAAVQEPDLPICYVAGPVPLIVIRKRERYGYARLGVAVLPPLLMLRPFGTASAEPSSVYFPVAGM
jgi:hypothetical protein